MRVFKGLEQSKWSTGVASGVASGVACGVASGVVGMDPNELSNIQSSTTLIRIKLRW